MASTTKIFLATPHRDLFNVIKTLYAYIRICGVLQREDAKMKQASFHPDAKIAVRDFNKLVHRPSLRGCITEKNLAHYIDTVLFPIGEYSPMSIASTYVLTALQSYNSVSILKLASSQLTKRIKEIAVISDTAGSSIHKLIAEEDFLRAAQVLILKNLSKVALLSQQVSPATNSMLTSESSASVGTSLSTSPKPLMTSNLFMTSANGQSSSSVGAVLSTDTSRNLLSR